MSGSSNQDDGAPRRRPPPRPRPAPRQASGQQRRPPIAPPQSGEHPPRPAPNLAPPRNPQLAPPSARPRNQPTTPYQPAAPNQPAVPNQPPVAQPRPKKSFIDPFEEFKRKRLEKRAPSRPNPQPQSGAYPTRAPEAQAPGSGAYRMPGPGAQQSPPGSGAHATPPGSGAYRLPPREPEPAGHDPFEEFRRKKQAEEMHELGTNNEFMRQMAEQAELAELGWVEGLGPGGESHDPKLPQGYIRGRYQTKAVDPNQIQRPAGYEKTALRDDERPTRVSKNELRKPGGFTKY